VGSKKDNTLHSTGGKDMEKSRINGEKDGQGKREKREAKKVSY